MLRGHALVPWCPRNALPQVIALVSPKVLVLQQWRHMSTSLFHVNLWKTSKLCITGPLLRGTAVHQWIPSQRVSNRENVSMMWRIMSYLIQPNIYASFSCDVSDWLWTDWDPMSWVHVQMGSVMSSYYHKHNGCRCSDVGYTPSHQQSLSGFKYIERFWNTIHICAGISQECTTEAD